MKKYGSLFLCILISLSAGFIGSYFTIQSIPAWYQALEKPFFTPPDRVFGPVWTILYILMGISLYLIITHKQQGKAREKAVVLFTLQLAFNVFWSIAFFGFQDPGFGLAVILVLWISILLTMQAFYKISALAARLLLPYFLWVSFASLLNTAVFLLN